MLDIKSLSFSYGSRLALENVNLSVKPGEIMALIGPNGAGKTTLMRAASGALRPQKGQISVNGENIASLSPSKRAAYMAVVPQARNLPEAFTVLETVSLGRTPYLGWLGTLNQKDRDKVRRAMEITEVWELRNRLIGELSGGEQQRVLLSRALAQDTPVLLLDEPTAHLDLHYQSGLLNLVYKLAKEECIAVLMALHDLNLVPLYAHKTALLVNGRLHALGRPDEVLTTQRLSKAYHMPLNVVSHPTYGTPLILPDGFKDQPPANNA
jgi:iron complex transport system ATP-binding protein